MRPVRLEIEGFSAFREPTVVDFEGVDLFAFVGPTGAGKSSVIDAMVFALYGSVPRYGSENLVHPVITQGAPEARVRLDFLVGDVAHTVVRVVRRTAKGATTKEARLERGDDVLVADAKSVGTEVQALLGLDFAQFTKCVVLPQGAFAALLHDTSASRQDLLVRLLDFGVYEHVAAEARSRARDAQTRLGFVDEQLRRLAEVTDEALERARARIDDTEAAIARVDDASAELTGLDEQLRAVGDRHRSAESVVRLLEVIAVPDDLDEVSIRLTAGEAELERCADLEASARRDAEKAETARGELGDPSELKLQLDAWQRLATLSERVGKGEAVVTEREEALAPAADELRRAEAAVADAEAALQAARTNDAAASIARHLHVGDDCPVCGNRVDDLPDHDAGALAAAEERLQAERTMLDGARKAEAAARRDLESARTLLYQVRQDRDAAQATLVDAPPAEALTASIAAIAAADERVRTARAAAAEARTAHDAARRARDEAVAATTDARQRLDQAREPVGHLGPPPRTDELRQDWEALARWADERRAEAASTLESAAGERRRVQEQRRSLVDDLRQALIERDIAVPDPDADVGPLRDACVAAVADARARQERLAADHERAEALRAEHAELTERRQVHELLGQLLGAKGFEAWLLDGALQSLVSRATEILEQLSSGRYAMAVDDKKQFEVIDHANADERRLARTLSGGETFLASLALALALADRVAELSATGATQLEAIFLDEGFGTLDPATLDVVATAIEELGAAGRMVGVVSHVRELAERVPVRFEVRRTPETATIERVEV